VKLNRFAIVLIALACIVPTVYYGILIVDRLNLEPRSVQEGKKGETINKTTTQVSCTRTSRLDNKPTYDRALSIIEEKYNVWDGDYLNGKSAFSFFPSQLVNCIKVEESNVRNTTGAEGYFTVNSSEIKENYFPITVDGDYFYTDDYINSLLLVHEITHVEQYIKTLNKTSELSCIDKEAEAFYAQWRLYGVFGSEVMKSIRYRIEYDKNLNPQLQIISTLINNYDPSGASKKCFNHESENDTSKCIDDYIKNVIKKIILQDDFYIKQCGL
jgi:hypothetical protein